MILLVFYIYLAYLFVSTYDLLETLCRALGISTQRMDVLLAQFVTYLAVSARASQGWECIFAVGKALDENETGWSYNGLPLSPTVTNRETYLLQHFVYNNFMKALTGL